MVLASTVLVWAALAGVERGAGQDRPHGDVRIEEVVDHPHEDVRIEEVVHDATGSIAATSVLPSPASRITTLQGSIVPTLFSILRASYARLGLQAPRMR